MNLPDAYKREFMQSSLFIFLRVLEHKAIVNADDSYHRWDSHHAHVCISKTLNM